MVPCDIVGFPYLGVLRSPYVRSARSLDDLPDLDGPPARHRNPLGDGDRLVEDLGIDQEEAAKLIPRLRKRADGDEALAVAYPDAGRRRRRPQRGGRQILPGRIELVGELRGFPVTLLPLGLVQGVFISVDQQHISHEVASILAKLALAAGHGPDDQERLGPRHHRVRQRGVRQLVGQILLAGEEPHERAPL
jgi:hypothetical protein